VEKSFQPSVNSSEAWNDFKKEKRKERKETEINK
jgi:hypothetical protein